MNKIVVDNKMNSGPIVAIVIVLLIVAVVVIVMVLNSSSKYTSTATNPLSSYLFDTTKIQSVTNPGSWTLTSLDTPYANDINGKYTIKTSEVYCRFVGTSPDIYMACGTVAEPEKYKFPKNTDMGYRGSQFFAKLTGKTGDYFCRGVGTSADNPDIKCSNPDETLTGLGKVKTYITSYVSPTSGGRTKPNDYHLGMEPVPTSSSSGTNSSSSSGTNSSSSSTTVTIQGKTLPRTWTGVALAAPYNNNINGQYTIKTDEVYCRFVGPATEAYMACGNSTNPEKYKFLKSTDMGHRGSQFFAKLTGKVGDYFCRGVGTDASDPDIKCSNPEEDITTGLGKLKTIITDYKNPTSGGRTKPNEYQYGPEAEPGVVTIQGKTAPRTWTGVTLSAPYDNIINGQYTIKTDEVYCRFVGPATEAYMACGDATASEKYTFPKASDMGHRGSQFFAKLTGKVGDYFCRGVGSDSSNPDIKCSNPDEDIVGLGKIKTILTDYNSPTSGGRKKPNEYQYGMEAEPIPAQIQSRTTPGTWTGAALSRPYPNNDVDGKYTINTDEVYCRFVGTKPDIYMACGNATDSEKYKFPKTQYDMGYRGSQFFAKLTGRVGDYFCRGVGSDSTNPDIRCSNPDEDILSGLGKVKTYLTTYESPYEGGRTNASDYHLAKEVVVPTNTDTNTDTSTTTTIQSKTSPGAWTGASLNPLYENPVNGKYTIKTESLFCRFVGTPPDVYMACGNSTTPLKYTFPKSTDMGHRGSQFFAKLTGKTGDYFCRGVGSDPSDPEIKCSNPDEEISTGLGNVKTYLPEYVSPQLAPRTGHLLYYLGPEKVGGSISSVTKPGPKGSMTLESGYPNEVNGVYNMNNEDVYCRFVGDHPNVFMSCGTDTEPYKYNFRKDIDLGYRGSHFFAKLEGKEGDYFCRGVGNDPENPDVKCSNNLESVSEGLGKVKSYVPGYESPLSGGRTNASEYYLGLQRRVTKTNPRIWDGANMPDPLGIAHPINGKYKIDGEEMNCRFTGNPPNVSMSCGVPSNPNKFVVTKDMGMGTRGSQFFGTLTGKTDNYFCRGNGGLYDPDLGIVCTNPKETVFNIVQSIKGVIPDYTPSNLLGKEDTDPSYWKPLAHPLPPKIKSGDTTGKDWMSKFDSIDRGYPDALQGIYEMNGEDVYCRFVGTPPDVFMSCGTPEARYKYNWTKADQIGYRGSHFFSSIDGRKGDYFCRGVGNDAHNPEIWCSNNTETLTNLGRVKDVLEDYALVPGQPAEEYWKPYTRPTTRKRKSYYGKLY